MNRRPGHAISRAEFVALMAGVWSVTALATDAMLPALSEMAFELGAPRANDAQWVITSLFLGMGLGQIIFGPWSDSSGRKPALLTGLALFALGSLISAFAVDFNTMIIGRVIAGVGAAGPRIVAVAVIRDQFEGREMARIMSFIVSIFILIPMIAPALGQGVLMIADWRLIFHLFVILAIVIFIWLYLRQDETLKPEFRIPFSLSRIGSRIQWISRQRVTMAYTLITGLISSCFFGYLATSQQLLAQQYGLGDWFPLVFAWLAMFYGLATLLNSRLVIRLGMRRIARLALRVMMAASLLFFAYSLMREGHPPFWVLVIWFNVCFFTVGLLFGNLNTLAMEPLGQVAGTGSAFIGTVSTLLAVIGGALIGQAYDDTVMPIAAGFGIASMVSLLIMNRVEPPKTTLS